MADIIDEAHEIVPTFWARVFLAGPIAVAEQILREACMADGLCVTIEPTKFVYTGGEEVGYVVGLVNYPRFPSTPERITERALGLAETLLMRTYQRSALVMTPMKTYWLRIAE
jgi:ferredoxin